MPHLPWNGLFAAALRTAANAITLPGDGHAPAASSAAVDRTLIGRA